MKKALALGIAASFFFAFTFVLNRSMNLMGGYWVYSACLRYFFTLPMIAGLVAMRFEFRKVHELIRQKPVSWLVWSTVCFGLFYAPLCYAGDHGESWLVAASWQMTIVMGVLTAPLFGQRIPMRNLVCAMWILAGVLMLQLRNIINMDSGAVLPVLIPIIIAAVSYPLGNRKMMELCKDSLDIFQRVYGMTLCSMPLWILMFIVALKRVGLPTGMQVMQSLGVAFFSGIAATVLFFQATNLVRENQSRLAVVESTQAGEVLFSLIGGIFVLKDPPPDIYGSVGIIMIILGIVVNSLIVKYYGAVKSV